MRGEVLILVNIPNSHFLLSLTHSALGNSLFSALGLYLLNTTFLPRSPVPVEHNQFPTC